MIDRKYLDNLLGRCSFGDNEALKELAVVLRKLNCHEDLLSACKDFMDIISESRGIVGWHLNGDELLWSQCEQVQQMADAIFAAEAGK